eukprot:gnl/Carplike_NY0171/2138_a2877_576.p3 GENE.gnl/Carplike_NY0171/2138_a2877_576~~gnl/Carplike_NY0171/2138_a2877_576.p3  ORF type:complete len:101 (-),score=7.51 gnl/Carplike_NY0171/2138_a2877_576:741-1043(-)
MNMCIVHNVDEATHTQSIDIQYMAQNTWHNTMNIATNTITTNIQQKIIFIYIHIVYICGSKRTNELSPTGRKRKGKTHVDLKVTESDEKMETTVPPTLAI